MAAVVLGGTQCTTIIQCDTLYAFRPKRLFHKLSVFSVFRQKMRAQSELNFEVVLFKKPPKHTRRVAVCSTGSGKGGRKTAA